MAAKVTIIWNNLGRLEKKMNAFMIGAIRQCKLCRVYIADGLDEVYSPNS